jgi:hypothetical protein
MPISLAFSRRVFRKSSETAAHHASPSCWKTKTEDPRRGYGVRKARVSGCWSRWSIARGNFPAPHTTGSPEDSAPTLRVPFSSLDHFVASFLHDSFPFILPLHLLEALRRRVRLEDAFFNPPPKRPQRREPTTWVNLYRQDKIKKGGEKAAPMELPRYIMEEHISCGFTRTSCVIDNRQGYVHFSIPRLIARRKVFVGEYISIGKVR